LSINEYCSEFARFNPLKNNSINNKKIYDVIKMGKTVTIELESLEQIWNDLSSKNRNVIRKSKKSGVKIYWGRSPILFDDFIPMYEKTIESDNASKYYFFNKEFFKNILDDLKFNSLIFYAIFNDKIISMAIIIFANGNMHYHLSASDKAYRSLAANNLLLYEVSCWGCENGFKKFHLGGGLGSQEDNLFKFKSAFNKDSNTYFSVGKRIFDIEKYDMLIRKRNLDLQVLEKSGFFPAYRI
jgi:lipid II:glycine glycyltransferase (peptidoglycan interpeptide bridge formation enzyme)